MGMDNLVIKKYYRKLRKFFPRVDYREGRFLCDLKSSLKEYSLEHPYCTYEDVVKEFGEPQKIMKDFLNNQEESEYDKENIKYGKRMIIKPILCICILCVLIYTLFSYLLYAETKKAIVDEKSVTIIEIEPESTNWKD